MALFPAYCDIKDEVCTENRNSCTASASWLANSSFKTDIVDALNKPSSSAELPSTSAINNVKQKRVVSKKRKQRKSKKKCIEETLVLSAEDSGIFSIDKTRNYEFLTVRTISRPSAPKYQVSYYITLSRKRKLKKFKRYFSAKTESSCDKSNSEEEIITKSTIDDMVKIKRDDSYSGFKQEEDLARNASRFNKSLAENPNDISMWLKYVHFQDTVYQFEKTFRKGSIAKGLRVTAERKLSILDKALSHNPNCEELHRERLNIAVSVFPADELQTQLKTLVEKDSSNIILWQGFIEATQCSMSHCNTDSVLSLYKKCLATLHKLRRGAALTKSLLEESILRMLYQCGLFLKQAGLFEQLWTLLRLYLELNLAPLDNKIFNVDSGFDEMQLVELEEVVFKSQLPLHELWLRTEKLRESCHWLPFTDGSESEDPQRIVFPEDVAELIHPITMPGNMFILTSSILTVLKIPLLPCRHVTMSDLGLDYVPWSMDSLEPLLSAFFNLYHMDLINEHFLTDNRLVNGPQYMKVLPGQEEYMQFILKIMKRCGECLNSNDQIAVIVWWFRFQRLLIILDKQNRLRLDEATKKRLKTNVKSILKEEAVKNNLQLYNEYALVEKELNGRESCINIITRVLSVNKESTVSATPTVQQQDLCHLYRSLVEVVLSSPTDVDSNKKRALKHLVDYATGRGYVDNQVLTQASISEALLIFKHISLQLLQSQVPVLTPAQQFLPNFMLDWIVCNGFLIYLTKGLVECGIFLEDILGKLEDMVPGKLFQKEVLYEFYISIIFRHCMLNKGSGSFKILDDVLYRAIELYPNNLFLLSVLAQEQSMLTGLGQDWWKVKNLLLRTNRAFPIIFLVLMSTQRIRELTATIQDTITGRKYEMDESLKNKMLSLFRRITRSDICTRRCGLIWRLYLQFVHMHFDPLLCRKIYYSAVEECPWLKALYIDAAIYIPAELAQIQDLIVEKQLRMHVTPEELDILRV